MIAQYFSARAKAVVAAVLVFLAQVLAFIGTGGYEELANLTLGQWIGIAMATAVALGFTYAVPNTPPVAPVPVVIAQGKALAQEAQDAKEAVLAPVGTSLCNSPNCPTPGPHLAH